MIAAETWRRLSADRVAGGLLRARRATPESGDRLLAALDADGNRHLIVQLACGEADFEDRQSRGLIVTTMEYSLPEQPPGRYLDIVCQDASGHAAFDVIGGEIAGILAASEQSAVEIVIQVLAKWRRFWGLQPRIMLSREEQIGLFAEVFFLTVWLVPKAGVREAVARWRGPLGARHDFEWVGRSVEVKATTSTRGRIHRINGLEQLQPPQTGDLLFFSLRLREERGASSTLPGIIAACRDLLRGDAAAWDSFEHLLARTGYSPVHEAEYAEHSWRVVEEGLFRVEGDFPRVTPSDFATGVPVGIERVEYEINLVAAGSHLVAASAEALTAL